VSQYNNIPDIPDIPDFPNNAVQANNRLLKQLVFMGSRVFCEERVIGISVSCVLKDPGPLILKVVHMVTIVL
jgi:hypothetical protein